MIQGYKWRNLIFLLTLLIVACGKPTPEIQGINLESWKEDQMGCKGVRKSMIEDLRIQKNKLLGLSEMEIIKLLGRPDENELYKRNQKFYHYYLEPSASCDDSVTNSIRLNIRFNAMGLAKEVAVD